MQPISLLPFEGNLKQPIPKGLIFNLIDYIELVDWTGRVIRDDKHGVIPKSGLPILTRLNISTDHRIELSTNFEQRFKGIAGLNINRSNSETLYGLIFQYRLLELFLTLKW